MGRRTKEKNVSLTPRRTQHTKTPPQDTVDAMMAQLHCRTESCSGLICSPSKCGSGLGGGEHGNHGACQVQQPPFWAWSACMDLWRFTPAISLAQVLVGTLGDQCWKCLAAKNPLWDELVACASTAASLHVDLGRIGLPSVDRTTH